MESLVDNDVAEQKPRSAALDRVTLGKNEGEKLNTWIEQAALSSKGFLTLSKSDLVNFLIHEHKADLSARELSKLRASHYDPIRHISWITQELKAALARGDAAMVAMLQNEIKRIELSPVSQAKVVLSNPDGAPIVSKTRVRRKRSNKKYDLPSANQSFAKADDDQVT